MGRGYSCTFKHSSTEQKQVFKDEIDAWSRKNVFPSYIDEGFMNNTAAHHQGVIRKQMGQMEPLKVLGSGRDRKCQIIPRQDWKWVTPQNLSACK